MTILCTVPNPIVSQINGLACAEPSSPSIVKLTVVRADRAIATEIGVDHKTVGKARKATREWSPVDGRIGLATATRDAVEKRIGLDGKAHRLRDDGSAPPARRQLDVARDTRLPRGDHPYLFARTSPPVMATANATSVPF
jgi:hypothetical protein